MIIHGATIHRDGHGKCGLLVPQILHCLAGLAALPPLFHCHPVSTNLTGTTIRWRSPRRTIPAQTGNPYRQKIKMVREAVNRGDNQTVKREMGKWFKMLKYRDNGISDVAADELYNFSLMVTPIAVPAGPVGLYELLASRLFW
jgi:hypothetical protein